LLDVQRTNAPLYRAYLLKESLAAILDRRQPNVARQKLKERISWASHSRLPPFAKVASTIKSHLEGVVAYVATGLSNGRTEGLNSNAITLALRTFGLHHESSLISILFLSCSGLVLHPPHVSPRVH